MSTDKPIAQTPYVRLRRPAALARDQRQPGYLQAVEAAAFGGDDGHLHLGLKEFREIEARFRVSQEVQRTAKKHRFALGDAVERVLTTVGITKELVQRITRKPCSCPARQRWLNQWGYMQQERLEKAVAKAAKWYGMR